VLFLGSTFEDLKLFLVKYLYLFQASTPPNTPTVKSTGRNDAFDVWICIGDEMARMKKVIGGRFEEDVYGHQSF
jgi:hypothetical protein